LYLETWMIITLIFSFGACSVISAQIGFRKGGLAVLENLLKHNVITIRDDKVVPGSAEKT
jgi:hypothetical protein